MLMHNPPHVGEILWEVYMEPAGISVTEVATRLKVSRQAISRLINQKSGISADMAIRLSKAFGTTPEFWINLEKNYELWQALQEVDELHIEPFLLPTVPSGVETRTSA